MNKWILDPFALFYSSKYEIFEIIWFDLNISYIYKCEAASTILVFFLFVYQFIQENN